VSAIVLVFGAFLVRLTTRACREPDPRDHRRQLIRTRPKAIEQRFMLKLWPGYSARDLETIADFIIRSTQASPACSEGIRNEGVLPEGGEFRQGSFTA
jgi:hypothetical protein